LPVIGKNRSTYPTIVSGKNPVNMSVRWTAIDVECPNPNATRNADTTATSGDCTEYDTGNADSSAICFQNNEQNKGYIPDHRECREYAADLEPRIDPEERPQKGRRESSGDENDPSDGPG